MSLADAHRGVLYEIVSVGGEGAGKRRLLDLGFAPKRKLEVRFKAKGGAVLVYIGGTAFALRACAAALIEVREGAGA